MLDSESNLTNLQHRFLTLPNGHLSKYLLVTLILPLRDGNPALENYYVRLKVKSCVYFSDEAPNATYRHQLHLSNSKRIHGSVYYEALSSRRIWLPDVQKPTLLQGIKVHNHSVPRSQFNWHLPAWQGTLEIRLLHAHRHWRQVTKIQSKYRIISR